MYSRGKILGLIRGNRKETSFSARRLAEMNHEDGCILSNFLEKHSIDEFSYDNVNDFLQRVKENDLTPELLRDEILIYKRDEIKYKKAFVIARGEQFLFSDKLSKKKLTFGETNVLENEYSSGMHILIGGFETGDVYIRRKSMEIFPKVLEEKMGELKHYEHLFEKFPERIWDIFHLHEVSERKLLSQGSEISPETETAADIEAYNIFKNEYNPDYIKLLHEVRGGSLSEKFLKTL